MKNTTYKLLAIGFALMAYIAASFAGGILDNAGNIVSNLYNGGALVAFYGQKMTDTKTHAAGGLYTYNLTQQTNGANAYVAMGFDHLWSTQPGAAPANYSLSGGVNLDSGDYFPATWFGVTNSWLNKVAVKGFGTMLVGTPTQGGSQLMNIERAGGYVSIHDWNVGNFTVEPDLGLAYGNRNGVNKTYDGNWWDVFFAISIHGKKP